MQSRPPSRNLRNVSNVAQSAFSFDTRSANHDARYANILTHNQHNTRSRNSYHHYANSSETCHRAAQNNSLGRGHRNISRNSRSLIIFDWDDTLFPSTVLQSQLEDINAQCTESTKAELQELSKQVTQTIETASRLSETVIITNAEAGWVSESSERFLPDVHRQIRDSVPVYSARSKFECVLGFNPSEWKKVEFLDQVNERTYSSPLHVISIGDADFERDAARNLRQYGHTVQTLKLGVCPTIRQLIRQLANISVSLEKMLKENNSFDVEVTDCETYVSDVEKENEDPVLSNSRTKPVTTKKYQHLTPFIPSVTTSIWHDFDAADHKAEICPPHEWTTLTNRWINSQKDQTLPQDDFSMPLDIDNSMTDLGSLQNDFELFSSREILVN